MKHFINSTLYELKQAYRGLKQKPLFVFSVVSTMSIALSALIGVCTLAYLLFIKPLPYPDSAQLVSVSPTLYSHQNKRQENGFSYPLLMQIYNHQQLLSNVSLVAYGFDILTSVNSQPRKNVTSVTTRWFSLLGAKFALGRGFENTEDINSYNPVVVISYQTWLQEFNLDKNILKKHLTLGSKKYSIIGVLAKSFNEPQLRETSLNTDIWLPWDFNSYSFASSKWHQFYRNLHLIAKLSEQISYPQANQKMTLLVDKLWVENVKTEPLYKGSQYKIRIQKLNDIISKNSQYKIWFLFIGALALVIIASTNLMNLFFARTAQKQHQLSVYAAIGAKKNQLTQLLFIEIFILMILSTLLSLAVTYFNLSLIAQHLTAYFPRMNELKLNVISVVSALICALLLALLFTHTCTRIINYKALNSSLQSSGKNSNIQVSKKLRYGLIISQVMVISAILFINISLLKQANNTLKIDLGFNSNNVSDLRLYHLAFSSTNSIQRQREIDQIVEQLKLQSQIIAVSQSSSLIESASLQSITWANNLHTQTVLSSSIDQNYFKLFQRRLLAGDDFSIPNIKENNNVIIVNKSLAKQLVLNNKKMNTVIGMKIMIGSKNDIFIIKGIVEDALEPNQTKPLARFYQPSGQGIAQLLIKFTPQQSLSREKIAAIIKQVSSKFVIFSYQSLNAMKKQRLFTTTITAYSTAAVAIICFLLATIGLYGISSYNTQVRRFEIGTRMAIGAKKNDLIKQFLNESAKPYLIGIFLSLLLIFVMYLGWGNQLNVEIGVTTSWVSLFVILLLSLIFFFASYIPLRQYMKKPAIYSLRGSE